MEIGSLISIPVACVLIVGCGLTPKGEENYETESSMLSASTQTTHTLTRSIDSWVSCDGITDDTAGTARAFDAASAAAFTLIVDCPVRLNIGSDISRVIFIDNNTTVEFEGGGKFIVNNVFLPAFVIANSNNIGLINWKIEYVAGLPVDWNVTGYQDAGQFISMSGYAQPAVAFNNIRLRAWLASNRSVAFDASQGSVNPIWIGPTNTSAMFYITGDTSNIRIEGMRLYVPEDASGDHFIPMAFSLSSNYKSNQIVTSKVPIVEAFVDIPHNLVFSNIDLDGTYMGWQGNARNATFVHVRSHRYGDLQDSSGGNVGGIHKWFAPPHLFYLNYNVSGDPDLYNRYIDINDVLDDGPRIGVARDKGDGDSTSGYASSLKIGCVACSVDGYKTMRPDGFLDVLPSESLTISNVDATYDSSFLNNLYPGWRFPSTGYSFLSFQNVTYRDSAAGSTQPPIGDIDEASNEYVTFRDVQVKVNNWYGQGSILPILLGTGNDVILNYFIEASHTTLAGLVRGNMGINLKATPLVTSSSAAETLAWASSGANQCEALNPWIGLIPPAGSRPVSLVPNVVNNFIINCSSVGHSYRFTLPLNSPQEPSIISENVGRISGHNN
jgi:hypothetical protein